ncbi:MAG: hypothetical protein BMS9Abin29_1232 [Gemmatimonadota bacterium]|nr:MAG: hypothetical protein BMS9Abin29_1232 [Gemmatimonadota bacterium]
MRKATNAALAAAGAGLALVAGCQELVPTATDASLIPINPITVEVLLEFDDFVSDFDVIGGFGSPADLGRGLVARKFKGTLDARTLIRFGAFQSRITVQDSLGVSRQDSAFTALGGQLVIVFDSINAIPDGPVTLTAAATSTPWDRRTATWDLAIDSAGDRTPWPTPGAGSSKPLGSVLFDRSVNDTVVIAVDSATIAAWSDTTNLSRGVMIDVTDAGARLEFTSVALKVDVRPSIHLDTIVSLTGAASERTFIFQPSPDPDPPGLRVGGTPAWRSIMRLGLPATLTGPPALCALVSCPLAITAERINQAELVLTTSLDDPAFAPLSAVLVDIRPVLAPELLPKSPLGQTLVGALGQAVAPEFFDTETGTTVSFPVTVFIQDLVRGVTRLDAPAPNTISVMTTFEPLLVGFASFQGPGGPGAPMLRLILTVSDNVQIP